MLFRSTKPNLSTIDYSAPISFEYKGADTVCFLTKRSPFFKSTSAAYSTIIQNRIAVYHNAADSLKFIAISQKNDIAIITKDNATNISTIRWIKSDNTVKTYTTSQFLGQPRWTPNAQDLFIPSDKGVFQWKAISVLPKMVIFEQNIKAFALNPIGTEIAYTLGNDTIYIKNILFAKANRKLPTLPRGKMVVDVDWK